MDIIKRIDTIPASLAVARLLIATPELRQSVKIVNGRSMTEELLEIMRPVHIAVAA